MQNHRSREMRDRACKLKKNLDQRSSNNTLITAQPALTPTDASKRHNTTSRASQIVRIPGPMGRGTDRRASSGRFGPAKPRASPTGYVGAQVAALGLRLLLSSGVAMLDGQCFRLDRHCSGSQQASRLSYFGGQVAALDLRQLLSSGMT